MSWSKLVMELTYCLLFYEVLCYVMLCYVMLWYVMLSSCSCYVVFVLGCFQWALDFVLHPDRLSQIASNYILSASTSVFSQPCSGWKCSMGRMLPTFFLTDRKST